MENTRLTQSNTIYQLKVGLEEISPLIWRRFQVPSGISLHRLHLVLQALMGWQNYHLYCFQIGDSKYSAPHPDNQDFELNFKDSYRAKLGKTVKEKGAQFLYEYDFGDGWQHMLLLEDILERNPSRRYPVCLEGENATPPEDCGGPYGYQSNLEIMQDPDHPEFKDIRTWMGRNFDPRKFNLKTVNRRLSVMIL